MKLDGKDRGWLTKVEMVVNFLELFRRKGKGVSKVSICKTVGY
jgi:NADH:ubiquinone oxidoreductase subunit E